MNMTSLLRHMLVATVAALLFLSADTSAAEPATVKPAAATYYSDDPAKWGAPFAWQPPEYPKALLEKRVTGMVDVLLNVSPGGRMTDIAALRSDPAVPAFEEAVREAVRGWTFVKAMDAECKSVATQSRLQVRFEMVDGKPNVNIGAAPAALMPGRIHIQEINRAEVNRALAESYPRSAGRLGKMGEVHALLRVDARTGETKSVDIVEVLADTQSYNPEPRMAPTSTNTRLPARSSPASVQFASIARDGLAELRFKPVPDSGQDVITVCREVNFLMRGLRRN
jgi:TonB family protein